jgi:hypothetical protein
MFTVWYLEERQKDCIKKSESKETGQTEVLTQSKGDGCISAHAVQGLESDFALQYFLQQGALRKMLLRTWAARIEVSMCFYLSILGIRLYAFS